MMCTDSIYDHLQDVLERTQDTLFIPLRCHLANKKQLQKQTDKSTKAVENRQLTSMSIIIQYQKEEEKKRKKREGTTASS